MQQVHANHGSEKSFAMQADTIRWHESRQHGPRTLRPAAQTWLEDDSGSASEQECDWRYGFAV